MSKSTFSFFSKTFFALVLATTLISQASAQCDSGTLSGTVFSDFDYNGSYDDTDTGVSGVRVRVYDDQGQTVGQALSNNNGKYTISGLSDGDTYMVAFHLGSDDTVTASGPDNGSDVQKIVAPYCDANLGLVSSANSCGQNTELILSCFVNGVESTNQNQETLIGIQHNFNGSSPVTVYATQAETGSVWGMAYDNNNDEIYSAAFVKQNTALGAGGHDAIYRTTLSGSPSTSILTTLTTLGQNAGTLSVSDPTDCDYGIQVGRIGLGAMDLDAGNNQLYVVNLHERTLVRINVDNPIPTETRSYVIPNPGCSDNDYRPFAVNYYNDAVYVGVTCTAETSRDDVKTSFHIYKLNPNTGEFSLEFSSDYKGGHWNDTPNWKQQSFWLTDIEFTQEGNMVLGISDRIGHRYCTTTNSRLDEQHGEILMVANVNGQWILEHNGIAGNLVGSGVNNNDGPGGGEFFGEDFFPADPDDHHNIAIGSIAIVPGTNDVVSSVFDPLFDNYSGGLHRYSTTDGSKISSQQLYNRNLINYFGKATGFGDIVTRCGTLSAQIGNYVWSDNNCDGIQNANESGIAGLEIELFDSNCNKIATTTTDNDGYYTFDNVNSGGNYTVAIAENLYDNVRGSYILNNEFYTPTIDNNLTALNSNLKNSSVCFDYPSTSFIAQSGNNTSIDIGLKTSTDFDLALTKVAVDAANIKVGDIVEFSIEVFNQGGVTADSYEVVDYLSPALLFDASINTGWEVEGGVATLIVDENLLPGDRREHTIRLQVAESADFNDYTNIAEISSSTDINGSNTDVDSQADNISTNDNGGQVNTTTDNQIDSDGSIDEDDHDPAELCILDLALMNVARSQATYNVGDIVTFDITVYNQGTVATTSFEIASNYPTTLDFVAGDNQGWSTLSSDIVTMRHEGILEPGDSKTYSVHYRLNSSYNRNEVVVLAEIASLVSSKPEITEDFDSTPDTIFGNDNGGEINTSTDNQIDDSGTTDEDDQDPASLSPYRLDLALRIITDREYVEKGDLVDFEIQLYNQGETSVSSVMIMNYIPKEFRLVDSEWLVESSDPSNQMFYKTINFTNGFNPGDEYQLPLTLEVLDAVPGYHVDYAEIGVVTDMSGNDVSALDIDSQADKDMTNDAGGEFLTVHDNRIDGNGIDDEDDQDPAGVYLASIEIKDPCVCKSNATNQFDGQYDEQVVVTAPSDQTWYLDFVFDIFDPTSAAPPVAPTAFALGAMGYQLIETPLGDGTSEYVLDGVIIDGIPYSVRVTNGAGAFLQISGGGESCLYTDPIIQGDGLSAVCGGSTFTYCIDPIDNCTSYSWTLSGGGVISGTASGTCVTVDWGTATGGPFELIVTPTCTESCAAPGIALINVGTSTGPMSCLSEINISLDDNCRTQLQAQDFLTSPIADGVEYQLMVTDHQGNLVPNAILTDEHLWTSLMVKVINPCDGNSCWSTINVEDKLGPEIQCEDITMPCYELDNYRPLVADNCASATFELVGETTKPLFCDEDFIKEVTRTYRATDAHGNTSACDQTILLERIEVDSIVFPENLTVTNMNNLICNDTIYDVDGRPRLDLTGVPTLYGRPLIPQGDYYCNFFIDYSDFTIVNTGCTTKIMRTFIAYEDWCSNNNFTEYVQTIEILDTINPTVICPENIVLNTDGTPGCEQTVSIPLPEATDNCGTQFTFDLSYPNGFVQNITTPETVVLSNGTNEITYTVYDECENRTSCTMNIIIEDNVSPVAICDRFTSVSLRSDGTAKAFAQTFDDGSFDDCKLFKFLTRRMNSNCDCGRPVFDDMSYLGERNGRLYYLSNYKTNAINAINYSTAFGGMILREESCDEKDFIFERVNEVNPGATYYTGITDSGHNGEFTFTNHAPIGCDAFPTTASVSAGGRNVIVDTNGNYMIVNGSTVETYFVVELSDPCGFSDEVKFCCEDLGEQMVVFRVIDKGGRFNDCMVNVTVQDKVAPEVTCPPDMEISCDTPIDFNNLSQFGSATASDSCAFTLVEEFVEGVNSCGQGMIMRTFTASDNGGSNSCTQNITLVNDMPFDLSSIILPQDFFTDMGCNSGDLQPENLPDGFGLPEFEIDVCAMIGITFNDQTFTFAGPDSDACLKILRTYTIIDWCQADNPGYEPITYEQTIKVTNTVGPELTGCDDIEVMTNDCDFGDVSFTVTATDDCTEADRLRVSFELQLSDGTVFTDATSTNSYTFTGKLPIGTHIALTSFQDLCGNVTTCSKTIDVINITAPTAACKDGLSIGLVPMDLDNDGTPDNEMACIFPEMIDASSTHICGLPIKLSFSSDTTDVKKVFDCTDLGLNEVQLWVTLCNPGSDTLIQSFCTITVDVQDNNNVDFCPKFDLALTKVISATSTGPFQPGDDVTFDINVINQGNVGAFNIGLVDYIPNGLTLNDTDWTDNANGSATLNVPIPFLEDSTSTVIPITFTIDANNPGTTVTNFAEISTADNDNDPTNGTAEDDDSVADTDPNDDGTVTDDAVDNQNGDEDDHDPADLIISVFDLALTKVTNIASTPGPYNPGDDVSFIITLFNQGNVDATDVIVTDYIPAGFTFNAALSPAFSLVGNNVQTTVPNLAGGATMSVGLTLTIDADYTGDCLINSAEIISADNADNLIDQDSDLDFISNGNSPELDSDNDIADDSTGGIDNPNDQDDYDPAKVDVICNLAPICSSVNTLSVTLDGNGAATIDVAQIDNGSAAQCDGSTITTAIDISSFSCTDVGSGNIVTLTITDSNGQVSSCQTNVTVIDDVDPTIQCQDVLTTLDDNGMIVLDGFVIVTSATDNCGVVDTTINTSNINLNTIDCIPQNATATVSDAFGNSATCTFQIAIENNPPVANCFDNFTLTLSAAGQSTLAPSNIDNNSTDDCTPNLMLALNQTDFDCTNVGTNTVILTVTDASGLSSTCTSTITVLDNTPPTALCSDVNINVDANGNASISTADIDNGSSDLCSAVTLQLDQTDFDCDDKGGNAVVLTVTDASNNSATCTAIVTVDDIIPPTVTCVADFTMQLDELGMINLSESHFIQADADNCAVTSRSASPSSFTCVDKAAPVVVTVTVSDACNNSAQCTVNVTVEDNIAPTCTLLPDLTFAPNVEITVTDVFQSFNDNCATMSSSTTIDPSMFTCDDLGVQIVTVTVNDDCGNSGQCDTEITIEDQIEPVCAANDITVCLDAMGSYTLTPADMMAITNGTTAGCDMMFTTTFSQTDFDCMNTASPVNIIVTLTVSDGDVSTCSADVTVVDKDVPTLTCIADTTIDLDENGQVVLTPGDIIATSSDNCPITSTINLTTLDCDDKDTPTTITATVTDMSGNSSTCTTTITVEDNTAPTCTLNADLTFAPNVTISVADVFNTFSDNCADVSSSSTIAPSTFTCMDLGTQMVTVTVNDDCGNSGTCTTNVEIVDMDEIVCVANDITVFLDNNGQYTLTQDNIDAITNGSSAGCDDMFVIELDIVDFLCNDANSNNDPVCVTVTVTSGNDSVTCKSNVTVLDNILPTVTCVGPLTLDLDADGLATVTPSMIIDMSDDNCSFVQEIDITELTCANKGNATTITATVTDQVGNTATCTTDVTVEDNMDPTCTLTTGLIFPPNVIIEVEDVLATFEDNCAAVSSSSTIVPNIFDCSELGMQMVTVTVNDNCGNSSTCAVDIDIQDSSVPTAVCQDITVNLDASGQVMIEGVDVDGGSSSACGTAFTFDVDPDAFACTDIGVNNVVLTVTSTGGSSSTCTAVVTVQDITPPTIVCPADQSLPCNSDVSNILMFGEPSVSDNCDPNIAVTEDTTTDINACSVGTISRLFTAVDNFGNSSTCTQVITINPPVNPITDADIIAPPTPITFDECFDPTNIVTQGPIVDTSNADCFDLSVSFTDNPDPSNLMCNGNFIRTWVVVDQCQSPTFTRTYNQEIILNDNIGPAIDGPNDVFIFIDSTFASCDTFLSLPATVTDCIGGFTVSNNSPFALDNNSADASGTYSGGTTDVTISATDACGSVSTYTYSVSVIDTTAFIKDCDKVIVSMQANQMVNVNVSQTNAALCSLCPITNVFTTSWSNTTPDLEVITLDCSFVGITNYTVYLWSGNSLVDSCGNLLQVLDGGGFCSTPNIGEVAGRVSTENDIEVEGVMVNLLGSELPGIATGTDGIYAFNDMPFGGQYGVTPYKDVNYLNGVSTADIIAIQRHILGSQILDSPYKIIAADVNNSEDVTTLDLIEIRKLILGIKDEFTNNTSWRMVDAEHKFIDDLNPFMTEVPEDYYIQDFNQSMLVDFIGVKVGDVNNSVIANVNESSVEKRDQNAFDFEISEREYERGSSQQITFRTADLASIEGVQMSLLFDTDKVDLVGFIPHVADLSIDHININMMDEGVLNISWNKTMTEDSEELFSVIVNVKRPSWTSEMFHVAQRQDYIRPEAYSIDGKIKNINLNYTNEDLQADELIVYQNLPNPWTESTIIKYYISNNDLVSLSVYDVNGKLLLNRSMNAVTGLNSFELSNTDLKSSGVMYYEITTSNKKDIQKMLLIK